MRSERLWSGPYRSGPTLSQAERVSPFEVYRRFLRVVRWRLQQTVASIDDVEQEGAYHRAEELGAIFSAFTRA